MIVTKNKDHFVVEVPAARKAEIAGMMAYRGLTFSTSASSRERAVLFGNNPYAVADLGDCPELAPYKRQIELSRALNGTGTTKLPPGKELWDFQKATLDYLIKRGGGIDGDQPGLGKTPTAIAFCNEVEAQRVLVIVPASVRIQWSERIAEWTTIPMCNISTMLKVKDGIHPTANYQILSYDAARNPAIIRAIAKGRWDVLICDEAHKMKNIDALTTRAILGNTRGEYQHGDIKMKAIASYCDKHLALTGTLLLNRPSECFSGSTLVLTNRGWIPIVQVRKTDLLWDGVEWVVHHGLLYQGCAPTVSVGRISVTATHLFQVKSSWVSADEVRQSTGLWRQALVSGSENLPFAAIPGTLAAQKWFNVIAIVVGKLAQPFKNSGKVMSFAAALVALRRVLKKQIQNITKSVPILNYVSDCLRLSEVSGTGHKTRTMGLIEPMEGGASVFGRSGLRTGRYFWRVLWAYQVTKSQGCKLIELIRIRAMSPATCVLLPNNKIWQIADKFSIFKHGWTLLWKKSKCSEPVYDLANAGPRQRFTVLSADGPVIVHNCYVLFRYFDHEAIDFMSEAQFKDRYNRQADMKTVEGKRFKLESTSLETELQNRLRVNVLARHEKKDVLTLMKPPRYAIVNCLEDGAVKGALDVEGMLNIPIDEITTTKDFEILGHIAEARRLMGIALAPQIIEYAIDFLEGSDEKLCIFGWHLDVLAMFEAGLSSFGTVLINGSKSPKARQKAVDDFMNESSVRVFIGNIQSAGTGLDGLQTVCSRCYLAEPDWVPAQNEQAVSRLDRIGQEGIVNAEIFVAPGSISEKILVKALEKMNVIHRVLDEKGN